MRWKIIELEVIEFVIKIVLQRIFDFHLKLLKQSTNYFITRLPHLHRRLLPFLLSDVYSKCFETFQTNLLI